MPFNSEHLSMQLQNFENALTENDEMLERMIGQNYKDKYTFLALIGNIDFKTGQTSFEVVPYMKGSPIEIT